MDIITWIAVLVMIFAVAAGWAQIAEIDERGQTRRLGGVRGVYSAAYANG